MIEEIFRMNENEMKYYKKGYFSGFKEGNKNSLEFALKQIGVVVDSIKHGIVVIEAMLKKEKEEE